LADSNGSNLPPAQHVSVEQAVQIGLEHHRAGRLAQAEQLYRQVLQAAPDNPDALHFLGVVAHQAGVQQDALQLVERALAIAPGNAQAWGNRGNILQRLKRPAEALASYDRSLQLRPDEAETLYWRGNVLQDLGRHGEALASYDRSLAVNPRYADALNFRGVVLHKLGRSDEALSSLEQVMALDPQYAPAWSNHGIILLQRGEREKALASFDRAIELLPGFPEAHLNRSLLKLLRGNFEEGWKEYEWRWEVASLGLERRPGPQPLWRGEGGLEGKTVLLHAEQGFGDTIQFCRYAELVAARGARVLLEVQPRLKTLLSGVSGAAGVYARGEPLPAFDLHCPLMSLPLAFATRVESIPARVPYLRPSQEAVDRWRGRLNHVRTLKVGLVWSGSPTYNANQARSISLLRLQQRLAMPGITLISLQKEVSAEDAGLLAGAAMPHFGAEQADFSDAAALASLMDLVISVDTAVGHLAGALGRPLWMLLSNAPHWPWLLEREDNPWYPTARLFRQEKAGDWDGVIARVARELRAKFG
jgi:tetratricopeptide (TPR) repeat protein